MISFRRWQLLQDKNLFIGQKVYFLGSGLHKPGPGVITDFWLNKDEVQFKIKVEDGFITTTNIKLFHERGNNYG